jgi:hypothetical protein
VFQAMDDEDRKRDDDAEELGDGMEEKIAVPAGQVGADEEEEQDQPACGLFRCTGPVYRDRHDISIWPFPGLCNLPPP